MGVVTGWGWGGVVQGVMDPETPHGEARVTPGMCCWVTPPVSLKLLPQLENGARAGSTESGCKEQTKRQFSVVVREKGVSGHLL